MKDEDGVRADGGEDAARRAHLVAVNSDPERIRCAELDERIGVLSAQIHALSAELVDTLVEFDEVGGWHGGGFRSYGQWLSIRTKFSSADAGRFARVAEAASTMPTLMADARTGQISTGVLDAAARVVTPANEEEVANVVRECTPAQAARVLSKYRELAPSQDGDSSDSSDPAERPVDEPRCWWTLWHDHLGRGRIDAALDPTTAALIDAAWKAARASGEHDRKNASSDDAASADVETDAQASDRLDANEIAARLASTMLDHAHDRDLRDRGGDHFLVQINVDLATLAEVLGLTFDTALPVQLGSVAFFAGTGRHLSRAELARIACDSSMQVLVHSKGVPLWMSNSTRSFTRHQRRALQFRSGGRGGCEYPGCTQTRWLDVHHVQHHENGGPTSLGNGLLLCGYHHRQHHNGHFRIDDNGDQTFSFWRHKRCLGTTNRADSPGGRPPDISRLPGIHRVPDPAAHIDGDTAKSGGRGEALTSYALDVFLANLLDADQNACRAA